MFSFDVCNLETNGVIRLSKGHTGSRKTITNSHILCIICFFSLNTYYNSPPEQDDAKSMLLTARAVTHLPMKHISMMDELEKKK
jgi:hypothetical protein